MGPDYPLWSEHQSPDPNPEICSWWGIWLRLHAALLSHTCRPCGELGQCGREMWAGDGREDLGDVSLIEADLSYAEPLIDPRGFQQRHQRNRHASPLRRPSN